MKRRRRHALLAAPLALAACHLVDRRDFDRNAGAPPPPPQEAGPPGPPAPNGYVQIVWTSPPPDYAPGLASAVRRALAIKPDALFTVTDVIPATGTPSAQADHLSRGSDNARQVADTVIAAGADRGQVELAARADPRFTQEEIRVNVR